MRFDFSFESASGQISGPAPCSIAILADFGGSGTHCQSYAVDFDNFEDVFAGLGVTLTLSSPETGASVVELQFGKIEDFHPDQLLAQVQSLAGFIELRSKLLDPEMADAAARELQRRLNIGTWPPGPPGPKPTESTEETLSRLLGKPAPGIDPATSSAELAQRLIQQVVGPNLHSGHPQQSQLVELAEAEITAGLNAILHQPAFQALEATWRGLDFLVRNVTEEVKLHVINISKSELDTMLSASDLAKSPIHKQLEGICPTVILGGYTIGPLDSSFLRQLGRLANLSNTALVAGGSPALVGCSSFDRQPDPDDWERSSLECQQFEALRREPEAARLGLVMPRFLLRQPYGKASDSIEAFPFEEMPTKPEHEFYLWGNSAFAYGRLLADAFAVQAVGTEANNDEIGGLPMHKFTSDGVFAVKPCAEAWLSERAAEAILGHGIMPLISIQGRDAARLWDNRSIANPPEPLPVHLGFAE